MDKIFIEILKVIMPMSIIIVFLLQAIKITKKMSGEAGKFAIDSAKRIGKGPGALIARNTIGRAASVLARSEFVKNAAESGFGSAVGGRIALRGLDKVAGVSFGGKKGGYKGAVQQTAKTQEAYADIIGEGAGGVARQAQYVDTLRGKRGVRAVVSKIPGVTPERLSAGVGIGSAGYMAAKKIEEKAAKKEAKTKRKNDLDEIEKEKQQLETQQNNLQAEIKTLQDSSDQFDLSRLGDKEKKLEEVTQQLRGVSSRADEIRERLDMTEKLSQLEDDVKKQNESSGSGEKTKEETKKDDPDKK